MAREAKSIKELLNRYLREEGLETPLNQSRLIDAWPVVTGKIISDNTGSLRIRNSVLYVEIKSAALRNNLVYKRKQLVELLNRHVGATVINDIVFW